MTRVAFFTLLLALTAGPSRGVWAQPLLTIDDAVAEALAHNRPLAAARSTIAAADARVRESRAAWFPRINVSEAWQRGNQPVFVFSSLLAARRFAAPNFAIDALNHPQPVGFFRTSVGVDQLLFDGGRVRSTVRAASLHRDLADTAVDETTSGLRLAVTETFGRLLAADAARRAAESALTAAQDDVTRARQRREAGMVTEADVLSLAVHVSDLEQRVIQSAGDAAVARAELNRLMGSPIDRDYRVVEPGGPAAAAAAPAELAALLAEAEQQRPELRRSAAALALSETSQRQARAAFVPQVATQAAVDVAGTSFADRASSWVVGGELRWTFSTGGADRARLAAAAAATSRARIEAEDARAMVQVEVVSAVRRLEAARARLTVGRAAVDQARESQRIIRDRADAGMASATDLLRASSAVLDAEAQRTAAMVDALVGVAALDKAIGRPR